MHAPSRPAFEAELRRLGYDAPGSFDSDPCVHDDPEACAVFVMPTREVQQAETYGQLGWLVYEGCWDCCTDCTKTLNCGGMYTHLRLFAGGVLAERFDDDEVRPAGEPIDDDA